MASKKKQNPILLIGTICAGVACTAAAAMGDERPIGVLEDLGAISAKGTSVTSAMTLELGVRYWVLASGTYQHAAAGQLADAEWDQKEIGKWDENAYSSIGPGEHDLIVNGAEIAWWGSPKTAPDPEVDAKSYVRHTFSESHTYWYPIIGTGQPITLHIQDQDYSDNSGELQAVIYGSMKIPVIADAGQLVGWGDDVMGASSPPAGSKYVAVTGGDDHSVAIQATGFLQAWGDNTYGQCDVPRGPFLAVDAADSFTIGLKRDGSLIGWGKDDFSVCSNVPAGNDFVAVSAGRPGIGIALRVDGTIAVWGNPAIDPDAPTGDGFIAIAAGALRGLALHADGSLVTWGETGFNWRTNPTTKDFVAIAAGNFGLALRQDGSLATWGYDPFCQVSCVPSGYDFVKVAAGQDHGVAMRSNGEIEAWGYSANNIIAVPPGDGFADISDGTYFTLALAPHDGVVGWGRDEKGQSSIPLGLGRIRKVVGGDDHGVALKADGSLEAWGDNSYGQCDVPEGNCYIDVAAASWFNIALRDDGSLTAWGDDRVGQLDVPSGNDFIAVAAGRGGMGIALRRNGEIEAWGALGSQGVPIGDGFVAITGGHLRGLALHADGCVKPWGTTEFCWVSAAPTSCNFVDIGAGNFGLVITEEGSLETWGCHDPFCQVACVPSGNDYVEIAPGLDQGFAMRVDGTITGWGYCEFGLMSVPPLDVWSGLGAGAYTSYAYLKRGASVPCVCDMNTSTGPGVCDIFDFLEFQNQFVSGGVGPWNVCDFEACTGVNTCDIFDFLAFQDKFVAGCQ